MARNYGCACAFVASQSQTFVKESFYGELRRFNSKSGLLHQETVFLNCIIFKLEISTFLMDGKSSTIYDI